MNEFRGILDLQVRSVLDALRAQRDLRCREITTSASRKAAQLLSDSRRRMRERVHAAVAEERRLRETALLESRHRIESAVRRKVQQRYRQFLHATVPLLGDELERRWRDPELRRAWCEMLIAESADRLAGTAWTVEHGGEWSDDDSRWLEQAFAARDLPPPDLRKDDGILAGLRVRLGPACIDATKDGLLARRQAVEARLLAAFERQTLREREQAND